MMRYHYVTFLLSDIAPMMDGTPEPDSYLSRDGISDALQDALAKGYRWVRTDGQWAIFERAVISNPAARRKDDQS